MSKKIDPAVLGKIKTDLVELVSGRNKRDTASFAAQLLAEVYYEIADAMNAGVTQAEIVSVFESNGVPMPLARFAKTMYYLRDLMPAPAVEAPSPDLVQSVSASLRDLGQVDRRPRAVRTKSSRCRIAMHDKVRTCAAVIERVCASPAGDPRAINREFRAELGHGWTLRAALQFAAGEPFGQWAQGAWPTADIARNVLAAHRAAQAVREKGCSDEQSILDALKTAYSETPAAKPKSGRRSA